MCGSKTTNISTTIDCLMNVVRCEKYMKRAGRRARTHRFIIIIFFTRYSLRLSLMGCCGLLKWACLYALHYFRSFPFQKINKIIKTLLVGLFSSCTIHTTLTTTYNQNNNNNNHNNNGNVVSYSNGKNEVAALRVAFFQSVDGILVMHFVAIT